MVSKKIINEIDRTIKQIWKSNIPNDYFSSSMLKEDSFKCCFYYHLRRKLATLLKENNLRIFTEYYFPKLQYRADIAIVQIDPKSDANHLKDMVIQEVAIIELKFAGGNSVNTEQWIKKDVAKIKNYIQSGNINCQFYFAVIYETECWCLNWMDGRSTNRWALGYVTELNAGYIDEEMKFEVNSYNQLNVDLQDNPRIKNKA